MSTAVPSFDDHFGLDNIPFGIVSSGPQIPPQVATRIRGFVVLLALLAEAGHFKDIDTDVPLASIFAEHTLNTFAALPKSIHRGVRTMLQSLLKDIDKEEQVPPSLPLGSVIPAQRVQTHLPVRVGGFTDFSVSMAHNLRAGEVILGKGFLPAGFRHFPLGYGGRSSSIVASGTPIGRPLGRFVDNTSGEEKNVILAPSRAVDYELEVAAVVGKPVAMRQRLQAKDADDHIFGLVLLNDWSARDIQGLEMMPFGPSNSKNFGTSISPWIVTLDALDAFRAEGIKKEEKIAPYLSSSETGTYSVDLTVEIVSNGISTVTCRSNLSTALYWNFRQMLTHQAIGGCSLDSGDLLACGTVSNVGEDARGCLMEATFGGKYPLALQDGTSRTYLEDGDAVRLTGLAGPGVGFGDCVGVLEPTRSWE